MKKVFTVIATVIVLIVIFTGVARWMNQSGVDVPPSGDDGETAAAPEGPVQPEHCPDIEFISAPGTWESRAGDDPFHPTANPRSYMLTITQPLQEQNDPGRVKVWTLPYTAQFRNINSNAEMSYDDSRNEGQAVLENELRAVNAECPLTDFIIGGFSQGAVIAGDVANKIGTGQGVIPAERIRGVALVADGRRQAGVGQPVGNPVAGVGAEIALQPLSNVIQVVVPGATMRGPRPGGFGVLDDRVFQICAPGDSVCDAPANVTNAIARAQELVQPNVAHATYATNENVIPGMTATTWMIDWANGLINQ